ncbi:MAG: hypothetical protein WCK89_23720 [bacterium]
MNNIHYSIILAVVAALAIAVCSSATKISKSFQDGDYSFYEEVTETAFFSPDMFNYACKGRCTDWSVVGADELYGSWDFAPLSDSYYFSGTPYNHSRLLYDRQNVYSEVFIEKGGEVDHFHSKFFEFIP